MDRKLHALQVGFNLTNSEYFSSTLNNSDIACTHIYANMTVFASTLGFVDLKIQVKMKSMYKIVCAELDEFDKFKYHKKGSNSKVMVKYQMFCHFSLNWLIYLIQIPAFRLRPSSHV